MPEYLLLLLFLDRSPNLMNKVSAPSERAGDVDPRIAGTRMFLGPYQPNESSCTLSPDVRAPPWIETRAEQGVLKSTLALTALLRRRSIVRNARPSSTTNNAGLRGTTALQFGLPHPTGVQGGGVLSPLGQNQPAVRNTANRSRV